VGIQELIGTYGLNGRLVSPQAAEMLYRREHQPLQVEAVIFSASNYLSSVTVNSNALMQFYSNRLSVYKIPDRVQVSYVKFDVTNFMAEAQQQLAKETNLALILNSLYQQQGPDYFTDTNGHVLPEPEAKVKIKEQLEHRFAMQAASKKASFFATDLFKMTPQRAENLNKLAVSNQYPVHISEPFSFDGPKNLKVLENFTRTAMSLTEDEPFGTQISGEDGVYVIALYRKIPSEIPPLDAIRLRVTEDYRRSQAIRAAQQDGEKFYQQVTNALTQGKSFSAICADVKVSPEKLPQFTLSTRDLPELDSRLDLSRVKELIANLAPGKVAPFTPARDGGYALYLGARLPVDEAELKKDFPDYLKGLRQMGQGQAFGEWFGHRMNVVRLSAPAGSKTTASNTE
jgi:hypothetical protein